MGEESPAKVIHDLAVANLEALGKPHEPCRYCKDEETPVGETSYTEDQLQSAVGDAVAAATGPLHEQIAQLAASQEQVAHDQAIADAVAAANTESATRIAELEAEVEELAMALKAVEDSRDEIVAFLETEVAVTAAVERSAERVALVKATGLFDEAFVDARADRYAEMTDEAWAEKIEELQAQAEARGTKTPLAPGPLPTERSALQATVEGGGESDSPTKKVLELAARGQLPTGP